MILQIIIFSFMTFIATVCGGYFSIKNQNKLHYLLSFSAGILLGIIFFALLPELVHLSLENNLDFRYLMILTVIGFLFIHILEKTILIHYANEEEYHTHSHPQVGVVSAVAIIIHSFVDGLAIGFGFQTGQEIGILIALAVIAHSFTDGMNTVNLLLKNKNTEQKAKLFLGLNAVAPIIGAISTLFFNVPEKFLMIYLAFFAGLILYISTSDILPTAHSQDSSYKTIFYTIFGILLIFLITGFIF